MPWFRLASCLTQDREIMVVRKVGGLWICFPGQKRQSGLGSNPNPVTYQLSGCGQVTSLDGASVSSSEKWAEFLSLRVLMGIQRVYASNSISTLPDIWFKKVIITLTVITASSLALPRNIPVLSACQDLLQATSSKQPSRLVPACYNHPCGPDNSGPWI